MRVGLLGPLELEAGSPALGPRDRLVLAALAMRRGQWMAADALADVLWPDQPPATWVKVVQGCVSRLRRVLGPESIETSPSGYRLRPELVELDVVELEDLVARARSGLAEGAAERAVAGFERALGLWRGRPLTELEEWPPAQLEAARLTELHLAAEEERLTAMLAAGRHQEVVGEALVQARQQPLREGRWITLALAQYRCGRQADALASIRAARRILGQQLGLDPGSELVDLERKILEQSPSLAADHEVRATSAACPWRGLASYDAEDVDTFFGREEDVAACLGRLVDSPLLVLAGPSGSGKSSLMKAGLIPALALQGRASVVCTPGADPVGAIAAARASSTTRDVVLCVDQAEEAMADRDEDLLPWLRALIDHADARGPVILTLRADHLPALALDPEFARLAERGLHLVSPLADDRLRQVIEEPARVAGLRLEHGLVDLMLRDAEDQPGALPLLSHALAETWQRRDGSLLTVDGYRESGGISGAVAASADRVYADLSDQQRGQLRWLMLRMAGLAEAGAPVRTPVGRDVALSDPDRARVLDLLVRTRLVTSDQSQYELAHEALVRAWPRLRSWLEEDQVAQRVWRHLAAAAVEWDRLGRPANELYTGVRLESALEWAARPESMPTDLEGEFLEASRERADAERQQLAAQARHERRQNRRLRILLAGLAVVLVAAMVAGVLAVLQAHRADRQSVAAIASAVGAKALKADDPQLALLLAAAAEQVAPTADTLRSLSSVIANRPLLGRVVSMPQSDDPGGVVTTIDRVFVMDSRAVVRAFDTQLRPVGTYDAGDGHRATLGPPFAADDHLLVVGAAPGDPRPIRLLDPETLTELPHQLQDLPADVYVIDLSLSANGRRLAVVYSPATAEHPAQEDVPNTIRVWDLATGLPAGPPIQAQARVNGELTDARWTGAGLSADGSTVYTSSPVAAYDVASGEPTWRHTNLSTWNNAMDVNGHLLAVDVPWGDSPGVQLFDTRTGEVTMTLPSDIGGIQEIVFSRDGTMIAATGTTGRATVWNVESGQSIYTIDTGGPPLASGAFSTFGGTLYVMKPFRRELQAWDLGNGTDRFVPRVGFDQVPGYANGRPRLARDGTRLAIEGYTGDDTHPFGLTIFDMTKLQLFDVPVVGTPTPENGGWLGAGAWAPSGDQYAAGYGGGWVQVIDAGSGTETNRRRVSDDGITALSYAGSDRLVAATQGGQVLLLDAETLQQVGATVGLPEGTTDVAGFSDGRTALVLGAGADTRVTWARGGRTWYRVDLGSGRVVQDGRLTMRQGLVLALAPDERRFAVGGVDGQVEIVDVGSGHAIRPAVSDGAGDVGHLAFDARGDRLAVGIDIGRPLALWDARTGTPLAATSLVEDRPGAAVAFAADGRVLAASSSGDVWTWDVSAAYAVRYACRVAGRELTRQEWSDAFGSGVPYRRTCSGR